MANENSAKLKVMPVLISVFFVIILIFAAVIIFQESNFFGDDSGKDNSESPGVSAYSLPPASVQESQKAETSVNVSSEESSAIQSGSEVSSEIKSRTFELQVPMSGMFAGDDYFEETIFIGDSITEGLAGYGYVDYDNVIAYPSINPDNVMDTKWIKLNGAQYTVGEVLAKKEREKVKRVYIMLGTNGIAWINPSLLTEKMGVFIESVKQIQPQADICVLSIPPVDETRKQKHNISNETVNDYNELLYEHAISNSIYFINTNEALCGEDGFLPPDIATEDGTHFKIGGYDLFFDYLKKHTVNKIEGD